jgi:hypothetical protein
MTVRRNRLYAPIKPSPSFFPRAPEQPSCPPPPAISAAGDITAPLAAVLNR